MDSSKQCEVDKAAQKLTDDISNMANYKSLYNEIQVQCANNYEIYWYSLCEISILGSKNNFIYLILKIN